MNEIDLCKKIKENLEEQDINISISEIGDLYINTLSGIDEILKEEDTLDISDFGSFWRKKGASSLTFFKPVDKLTDLIKSK